MRTGTWSDSGLSPRQLHRIPRSRGQLAEWSQCQRSNLWSACKSNRRSSCFTRRGELRFCCRRSGSSRGRIACRALLSQHSAMYLFNRPSCALTAVIGFTTPLLPGPFLSAHLLGSGYGSHYVKGLSEVLCTRLLSKSFAVHAPNRSQN